jgi:diguanylate cyclase (GGDEF)-like protein/PAS domain S-box-containing protein
MRTTASARAAASDADLRLVADSLPHIVWTAAPDGSTEYFNRQASIYCGARIEVSSGWDWMSLVHPDDVDRVRAAWALAIREQSAFREELRLRRLDRAYLWHAFRGLPVRDERGTLTRWVCTATDIQLAKDVEGELRIAERQLGETLALLEVLQSEAPVGFGFVDRGFRFRHLNATLAALDGSTVADYLGRKVSDLVPEMWPKLEPLYDKVLETGEASLDVEIEGPMSSDPSQTRRLLTSHYPISSHGEIVGIGIVVLDITARKQAEEAMRFQSELLAAAGQAIVAVNLERNVIYWNRAAEEMYGWTAAEALGRPSIELIVRNEEAGHSDEVRQQMLKGERWSGDYEILRRDGSSIWVLVTNTPMFGSDGRLVAVIGSSIDVTERKRAEAVGRRLTAVVDGSADAIFGLTDEGIVVSWNPAAVRLFGYTSDEILGQPIELIAPADRAFEQSHIRDRLMAGGAPERLETMRRRKDGSLVDVVITASTSKDEAGRTVGLSVIAQDITTRVNAQRALEASRRRLAEAQRIAMLGSFEYETLTGASSWSDEFYRIAGVDPSTPPGLALFLSVVHPDDLRLSEHVWVEAVERGVPFDVELRIIQPDSTERYVRIRAVPDVDAGGRVERVSGTMVDDTERVAADKVRRTAETRFEIGFEQSAIGAAISDLDGIPLRVNPAACEFFERSAEQLIGIRWTEFTHPDEVPLGQAVLSRLAAGHDTYADERRYLRPDGSIIWALTNVSLVRDDAGEPDYFYVQLQDITSRKLTEHELAHQALHDTLTGLPNRALLEDRLVHGLAGSRRRGSQLGVMFLDIDQFKMVNDSLGHSAGDDLLKHAAERITAAIRPGDTVARFGGDEFVVVCDDVSEIETEHVAERVLEALSRPWHLGSQEMHVTASLGIAVADDHATPESLLRDSDSAMYRAKERGRGRIELFDEALRLNAKRRLATASALHRALEREEFVVQYQPVVDLTTGAMVSAEALVRWKHPEHGMVTPDEFISLAEETGLIVPIGARVLEQACVDLAEWHRAAESMELKSDFSVAVNLSVRQMLAPGIADLVADALARTGIRAGDLCLELTESVFMEDVDYFGRTLASLKDLGVDLSIDDFGTGYSSLSYLKRFPVDGVKVDRAFVDGLGTDPHDTALVAAIVAMASALDLQVTAEGVETHEQLLGLKTLGVPRAQGFYLARPMAAASIARLVAESHRWKVD